VDWIITLFNPKKYEQDAMIFFFNKEAMNHECNSSGL